MGGGELPDPSRVLERLKPFQRDTAEHVFRCLYEQPDGSRRFLVADEVGLGKTLVARGVIARAIHHLWPKLPEIGRIDVVYICSNGQIARQNLNRLNVIGGEAAVHATRVTMLPVQLHGLREREVNFISFTPGSSFDLTGGMGQWQERIVLYWMLRECWGFGDVAGPKNFFQGGVTHENTEWFREQVAAFPDKAPDRSRVLLEQFAKALADRVSVESHARKPTIRDRFESLCDRFGCSKKHIPKPDLQDRMALIGELRDALASSCIKALEPDIVILDEFQRFKHLLSNEGEAGALAHELFEYSDKSTNVRVLLLSATPYKMYTLHGEADTDDHYRDFLHTLRFLFNDDRKLEQVRGLLHRFRQEVYRAAAEGSGGLADLKREIEALLGQVMVRTERLGSTRDGAGMLVVVPQQLPGMTSRDIGTYLHTQRLADELEAGAGVIEYWKSAPYLLNFMQGYKLKREFDKRVKGSAVAGGVAASLAGLLPDLLPWRDVEAYRRLDPGNVRLAALERDMVGGGLWRLLWLPPSMPYYRAAGPFEGMDAASATKRLVFSGWAVVPRAVSAVLSYEAERRIFQAFEEAPENTVEARKRRRPLLQLTVSEGRPVGMPVLALMYPAIELARAGDAEAVSWAVGGKRLPALGEVLDAVRMRIERSLTGVVERFSDPEGPEDERWYWAAPLLIDLELHSKAARAWLTDPDLTAAWSGTAKDDDEDAADTRWADHVEAARSLAAAPSGLGRAPADLAEVMSEMAVAGPAVSALRALARVVGSMTHTADPEVRTSAARVGWAFRAFFNRQRPMALLRGLAASDSLPYWRLVLRYCADGVVQAVLDEYAHLLRDTLGLIATPPGETARQIGDEIAQALTMRTASLVVDEIGIADGAVVVRDQRMRLGFALPFGDQRDENQREGVRQEQVRAAFNSPFWPYVLVSTSVGQEGLDFHPYCHAVMHWNLPSNPVDLEQREGRVHRYKGHAVRKNVAKHYAKKLSGVDGGDPWEQLFQLAETDADSSYRGMVPFWVFDPEGGCRIERHVPTLPLSRDVLQYEALCRSLAVYRMVFGQPRQEDLVAYLVSKVTARTTRGAEGADADRAGAPGTRDRAMLTLGVDLASDPSNTGVCVVRWNPPRAKVAVLRVGADDRRIVRLHALCNATGIDAPFGWSVEFVRLVRLLPTQKTAIPGWFQKAKPDLRYRATDHYVQQATGQWPLAVSADRIAMAAMRCQGLLARMGVTDRSGDGRVFEVYPAAALKRWGLPHSGYKAKKGETTRERLLEQLLVEARWLHPSDDQRTALLANDNALDALLCALIARAAALGLADECPDELKATARTEGWIHLPRADSLEGSRLCW